MHSDGGDCRRARRCGQTSNIYTEDDTEAPSADLEMDG